MPAEILTSVCGGCGYDFAGLPAVGTCPECGRAYDDAYLILPAWPTRVLRRLVGVALLCSIFVASGIYRHHFGVLPTAIVTGLVVLSAAWAWDWFVSPWPTPRQLWLSPAGLAAHSSGRRLTLAPRFYWIVRWTFEWALPFVMLAGLPGTASSDACGWVGVTTLFVFFAWMLGTKDSNPPPKPFPSGVHGGPNLIAWAAVTDVKLTPRKGGRFRLIAIRRVAGETLPLVSLDLLLTPAAADDLSRQIFEWRGRPMSRIEVVSGRATAFARRARKAAGWAGRGGTLSGEAGGQG